MAAAIGADVDQLRALAKQFTQAADRLQQSSSGLSTVIANAAFWRGNDANRFRTQWRSQSTPSITAAVNTLRTASDALVHNAAEQDQASAAGGGSTPKQQSDGVSSGDPHAPPAADGLHGMWNEIAAIPHDSDGYRIQTVMGDDGVVRYIVYIGGTNASDTQSMSANVPALSGTPDADQLAALNNLIPPGASVMLVGYSQGGMDAQNIAASPDCNFDVKQIVTFGSAARKGLNIPAIHLRADTDSIPGAMQYENPDLWSVGETEPNSYSFHRKSDFWNDLVDPTGIGSHVNDYPEVSREFDTAVSQGGRAAEAAASLDQFQGTVINQYDIYGDTYKNENGTFTIQSDGEGGKITVPNF